MAAIKGVTGIPTAKSMVAAKSAAITSGKIVGGTRPTVSSTSSTGTKGVVVKTPLRAVSPSAAVPVPSRSVGAGGGLSTLKAVSGGSLVSAGFQESSPEDYEEDGGYSFSSTTILLGVSALAAIGAGGYFAWKKYRESRLA